MRFHNRNAIIFLFTSHEPFMTTDERLAHYKAQLAQAETEYSHCIARGDWDECSHYKNMVAKYRRVIGQLIKQRMALA